MTLAEMNEEANRLTHTLSTGRVAQARRTWVTLTSALFAAQEALDQAKLSLEPEGYADLQQEVDQMEKTVATAWLALMAAEDSNPDEVEMQHRLNNLLRQILHIENTLEVTHG